MSGKATYECVYFPQPDGSYTFSYTISTACGPGRGCGVDKSHTGHFWTSPEVPLEATTDEEARIEARRRTIAMRSLLEGD